MTPPFLISDGAVSYTHLGLSGLKVLKADPGLTPASIEGKFTFTVSSGDAAAPMPERTSVTKDVYKRQINRSMRLD